MISANVEMLELAAAALADLPDEVVFVGGATVELWATDEAVPEFRPTEDVDVIVEIATRTAYYRFEDRLREAGFLNAEDDGVICRFRHRDSGLLLDAMPTEPSILGFENRWQKEAFRTPLLSRCRRADRSGRSRRPTCSRPSSRRSVRAAKVISMGAGTSRTWSP